MDLQPKVLDFLYEWVNQNKIPHIKKGMKEDLENFIINILADDELKRSVKRMTAQEGEIDEQKASGS